MPSRPMTMDEIIIRRSIEVLQSTIEDLCRKRDALADALPNAPRPAVIKTCPFTGGEIKQGGGKKRRKEA